MTRPALLVGPLLLACAACAPTVSSPTPAQTKAPYTLAPPTPTISPAGTPAPTGPGQPYTAAALLPYFQTAPATFPESLKTQRVAAALAAEVWSFDAQPYRMVWLEAFCEGQRCEVSLTGLPTFAPTIDCQDTFALSLDERTGVFSESQRSLRGFPPELIDTVDQLARSLDTKNTFSALPLLGAEWVVPPPADAFRLRYGKGNEEGDPTYLVTVSRATRMILRIDKLP